MTSRSCPIGRDGLKSPSLLWKSAREVQSLAILRLLRTEDAEGSPRTYCSRVIAAAEVGRAHKTPHPIQAFAKDPHLTHF